MSPCSGHLPGQDTLPVPQPSRPRVPHAFLSSPFLAAPELRVCVICLHGTWRHQVSEDGADRLQETQAETLGPTHSSPNSKSPPGGQSQHHPEATLSSHVLKGCSARKGLSSSHTPRNDTGMTRHLGSLEKHHPFSKAQRGWASLGAALGRCWWTAILWTPGYLFSERLEVRGTERG